MHITVEFWGQEFKVNIVIGCIGAFVLAILASMFGFCGGPFMVPLMTVVLGLSHLTNLIFGRAVSKAGFPFELLGRIASTTFAKQIKTAAEVAEEAVGGVVQLIGKLGAHHEVAHQDEQRDDRERVRHPGFVGDLGDHRGRDVEIELVGYARETDDAHGKGHRHAQECEDEERRESDEGFDHGPTPSPGMVRCGRRNMSTISATAVSAIRMLIA